MNTYLIEKLKRGECTLLLNREIDSKEDCNIILSHITNNPFYRITFFPFKYYFVNYIGEKFYCKGWDFPSGIEIREAIPLHEFLTYYNEELITLPLILES